MSDRLPSELWQVEIGKWLYSIDRAVLRMTCKTLHTTIPYKSIDVADTDCDLEHLLKFRKLCSDDMVHKMIRLGKLHCVRYLTSVWTGITHSMVTHSITSEQLDCFKYLYPLAREADQNSITSCRLTIQLFVDCFIRLDNSECLKLLFNTMKDNNNDFIFQLSILKSLTSDSPKCFEYLTNGTVGFTYLPQVLRSGAVKCSVLLISKLYNHQYYLEIREAIVLNILCDLDLAKIPELVNLANTYGIKLASACKMFVHKLGRAELTEFIQTNL